MSNARRTTRGDESTGVTYELLSPETVTAYVRRRPALAALLDTDVPLKTREIGDGNLNLIFVVHDSKGASLVLKQALPYVRMAGPSWPLTPERNTEEARALKAHGELAPEFVPALYDFDHASHVIAMEDLSSYRVWRAALNDGVRNDGAASDMGTYAARIAFGTSLFNVEAKELKARIAEAINPWLCEITEDLVFTEPYIDAERDWFQAELIDEVQRLRKDRRFVAAMGEMKYAFMTQAEALIHGDLHTGSVMVGEGATAKAIDSEFAYYGPVGFDLSCLFGNYVLAYVRAMLLDRREHAEWIRSLCGETWNAFSREFRSLWPKRIDPAVFTDDYLEHWLDHTLSDAIGMTAAELCRRTIGYAHVSDVETLDVASREKAVSAVLRVARHVAPERTVIRDPDEVLAIADDVLRAIGTQVPPRPIPEEPT